MLTWLYSERRWPIELGEFLPASLGHLHSDPFIRIVLICISKATTTVQCSWHDFQGGHLGFDIYQSRIFAGIRKFVVTLLDPTASIPHLDSMSHHSRTLLTLQAASPSSASCEYCHLDELFLLSIAAHSSTIAGTLPCWAFTLNSESRTCRWSNCSSATHNRSSEFACGKLEFSQRTARAG